MWPRIGLMGKPTVSIDFDGVLHAYTSGWQGPGVVADGLVPGAIEWLLDCLAADIRPAIYSSRSTSLRGRRAMKRAIRDWGAAHFGIEANEDPEAWEWNFDKWTTAGYSPGMDPPAVEAHAAGRWLVRSLAWPWVKPPAVVTVDDRAICFRGSFSEMEPPFLLRFKPWNK